MTPTTLPHRLKIGLASGLAVILFLTQGLFLHAAEANFWAQRADVARRVRSQGASGGISLGTTLLDLAGATALSFPSPSLVRGDWTEGVGRYGTIRRAPLTSGPFVIHLQDVHGHAAAQENLAALVGGLLERFPDASVVLEGAAGPISLADLRSGNREVDRGAAAFFLNAGILTGAEYAVWVASPASPIFGGEDPDLYRKNRESVDRARAAAGPWRVRLNQARSNLDRQKAEVFSSALLELDAWSAKGAKGDAVAERTEYLLSHPALAHRPVSSTLATFGRLVKLERVLSLPEAERDRLAFIQQLGDRLSTSEATELSQWALAFRAGELPPASFYARLDDRARERGVPLKRFPAFDAYVRYVLEAERLDPETLQRDLQDREDGLWGVLAQSPEEKILHEMDRDLRLLDGLTDLRLTPAEWTSWRKRRASPELAERLNRFGWTAAFARELSAFEPFFELAEARNHALAENTRAALRGSPAGTPVLLVAGGFHNPGLTSLLSGWGVGVVAVSPRLGDASEGMGPFALFTRDRTPLEALFDSPRVTLAETLALSPLTTDGNARARAVRDLAGPVREAIRDRGNIGAPRTIKKGSHIVVVRAEGQSVEVPPQTRPVVQDVPAFLSQDFSHLWISVFHRPASAWGAWFKRARTGVAQLSRTAARGLSVLVVATFLLPLSGLPSAYAYTLTSGPDGVQVMVEKGEHLWGAARHVLKSQGVSSPSNVRIADQVKAIADANGLSNPNLIHPDTPYRVPSPLEPTADVSPASSMAEGETLVPSSPIPLATPDPGTGPSLASDPAPLLRADSEPSSAQGPWLRTETLAMALAGAALAMGGWGFDRIRRRRAEPRPAAVSSPSREALRSMLQVRGWSKAIVPVAAVALFGGIILTIWAGPWAAVGIPWREVSSSLLQLQVFLFTQWPVVMALAGGLMAATYFVWFRAKEVDLSAVERGEPRIRDWSERLDLMESSQTAGEAGEEDLSWLGNNVHALILNHRVTETAVSDRGQLERRIDLYRSMARLAERTVRYIDRQLESGIVPPGNAHDRLVDTREKFFLYQLYGLKTAHALVPASVAQWALGNFDRRDSWFERRKFGSVLRFVRGVRPMLRQTVKEYRERLLQDRALPGKSLWETAEGLSVTGLGNILVPGLYSAEEKESLAQVFDRLTEKVQTKELSDMSAKDLHRKGWGTLISLIIWSVAISRMVSVFPALLAFVTGLGVTMALFRFQALGARRDGFYRSSLKVWRQMNLRPHSNGRFKGNGEGPGEDPFHLNRDFARFHFEEGVNALRRETSEGDPATDVVLLIAQSEEERVFYEQRAQEARLFPARVPVVVLSVPPRRGSFFAYAKAWRYFSSQEFEVLARRFPHLKKRPFWALNVVTLVSKGGDVAALKKPLTDLAGFQKRVGAELLGPTTLFDLAIMNAYRAAQARRLSGTSGGMAFRYADRAYLGPVRVAAGAGVTLDAQWANADEMARFNLGAVIASLDKPLKLIRRSRVEKTLSLLAQEHTNRVYDLNNPRLKQYQGFTGEGFYAFDEARAQAHDAFLQDVLDRLEVLPASSGTDPPSLNLMTFFLVPLCIAQNEDGEATHKINTYFSGHGFFSHPFPEEIQRFNNRSANVLATTFQGALRPGLSLNAAFVDESLYASADAASDQEDDDVPFPTASQGRPWKARFLTVVRTGAAGVAGVLAAVGAWLGGSQEQGLSLGAWAGSASAMAMAVVGIVGTPSHLAERVGNALRHWKRGSRDVTEEVQARPAETLAALVELSHVLRSHPLSTARTERELIRLMARAALEMPMALDRTSAFDLGSLRAAVQQAESERKSRRGRSAARPNGAVKNIIEDAADLALARQLAQAWLTFRRGGKPVTEMRQAGYLLGLAGRPFPEGTRALLGPLGAALGVSQGASREEWGDGVRDSFQLWNSAAGVPAGSVEAGVTAVRVTEILNSTPRSDRSRALRSYLRERAARWTPGAGGDVLVVEGLGLSNDQIKNELRRRINHSPLLDSYLAACHVVVLKQSPFPVESVLSALPTAVRGRGSLTLFTADPTAVVFDARKDASSYRVLLLQWAAGELQAVDLVKAAQEALRAARIFATSA